MYYICLKYLWKITLDILSNCHITKKVLENLQKPSGYASDHWFSVKCCLDALKFHYYVANKVEQAIVNCFTYTYFLNLFLNFQLKKSISVLYKIKTITRFILFLSRVATLFFWETTSLQRPPKNTSFTRKPQQLVRRCDSFQGTRPIKVPRLDSQRAGICVSAVLFSSSLFDAIWQQQVAKRFTMWW